MEEVLSWQAVFTIVGSVVAITVGVFGYLIKTRPTAPMQNKTAPVHLPSQASVDQIHSRISDITNRLSRIEGEASAMKQKAESMQGQMNAQEHRAEKSFEQVGIKLDKLTDILMKILTDDKL